MLSALFAEVVAETKLVLAVFAEVIALSSADFAVFPLDVASISADVASCAEATFASNSATASLTSSLEATI